MQIVILAAGMGKRLAGLHQDQPKSLMCIQEKPYLAYQLESLQNLGVQEIIIVGGFAIDQLQHFLNEFSFSTIQLVENTEFEKGNLYSLYAAKPLLKENFYLFNADHFYSPQNYQKILNFESNEITVFCDQDRHLTHDDMKVDVLQADGRQCVTSMSKQLERFQYGYVGVTYIPKNQQADYWSTCQNAEKQWQDKAHVENVIDAMAKAGQKIPVSDISGSWWTEIDTPEDFQKAQKTIIQNLGLKNDG